MAAAPASSSHRQTAAIPSEGTGASPVATEEGPDQLTRVELVGGNAEFVGAPDWPAARPGVSAAVDEVASNLRPVEASRETGDRHRGVVLRDIGKGAADWTTRAFV